MTETIEKDPLDELRMIKAQWAGMYLDQIEPEDLARWFDTVVNAIAAWEKERYRERLRVSK